MPFNDIKGQKAAVEVIMSYKAGNRIEGGYLFTGPRGVGKRMTAVILSQSLNCLSSQYDACGLCPSCVKIANGQHPDVHIILAEEGQIKIEQIRQLQKEISLKAYEGKFKLFIIDNAHMLNAEAANCLLKVLEEPPKGSLIILVTDKPGLLFKTVVSRCKVIRFKAQERTVLKKCLEDEYGLNTELAHFLAYFCEGRFGEAIKLKDSNILEQKNNIINKLITPGSFDMEGLGIEDKKTFSFVINIVNAWFRDIYLIKNGLPCSEVINFDRKDDLKKAAGYFSSLNLEKILSALPSAAFFLERNINTRLLLHNLKIQIWQN